MGRERDTKFGVWAGHRVNIHMHSYSLEKNEQQTKTTLSLLASYATAIVLYYSREERSGVLCTHPTGIFKI